MEITDTIYVHVILLKEYCDYKIHVYLLFFYFKKYNSAFMNQTNVIIKDFFFLT